MSQPTGAMLHPRAATYGESAAAGAAVFPIRLAAAGLSLTIHDRLEAVEADWRRFEETADCTVFQSFAWQSLWRKHIGAAAGVKPVIVLGRQGERIVCIFPLAIERGRLVWRLTWHAGDLCDYNGPLLAPDFDKLVDRVAFGELFGAVRRALAADPRFRFDAIFFEKMPETIGGQANPFVLPGSHLNPSGAYVLTLSDDWETLYRAKRSSATRRRDRTKHKRLDDIGAVRFVTSATAAEIEANLDALATQKSAQLRAMGAEDVFARPGFTAFFHDLATGSAAPGMAHVSQLAVGSIIAAANFGLIFRGSYYHILASYDAGPVSRYGPGAAHLHELMRYAIERGCTAFDFTIGDEQYKREWADTLVGLYDYRAAATPAGWLVTMAGATAGRAKRVIKQNPRLWALASGVRMRLAALRGHG